MESKYHNVSDIHVVIKDCFGMVSNYFNNSNASALNESQYFDANDNQYSGCSIKLSVSPQQNITCAPDIVDNIELNEPPLLEELEIYPGQIKEKAMIFMNPFLSNQLANEHFLIDTDLFGPIFFCFLFGACLFLAGKVFIFSHLYALSMVSVLGMYILLKQMSYGHQEHFITIKGVASALGYGMLHMVWFSIIGIFFSLNTMNSFSILAGIIAVCLSTFQTARILGIMSNQSSNGALIAYPTAIIYILFTFLVIF
ncbi:protein YIPF5-like [Contarinia nasturtii]|uniref:protein YIPF5-like n=1 Tax=Contarinia nasturtii TaxID=265458 RepID=UPI0012D3C031|nr:protein YIPF5-like [Contarinia nasturtii]